jgi:hypothetical protein
MTSYPFFDEFQKKQEEILEDLAGGELSCSMISASPCTPSTWRRP